MTTAKCKSCGAEIVWARTASGKRTPLDAKPVRVATLVEEPETGNEIVEDGLYVIEEGVTGFVSHWGTCPTSAQHRRKS